MAISFELIGKLGGGGVEQIPVERTVEGRYTREVFHTIEVPEGETWLVALHGNLTSSRSGGSNAAQLFIGSTLLIEESINGIISLVHVGTGTIEVGLKRNHTYYEDHFEGRIYAAKM